MSERVTCSIKGCTRTSARSGEWICSVHWRRHCPPRSRRRRAYLRFHRLARERGGWDMPLRRQFWRFWDTLVRTANAAEARGSIDMREINKMFGFDQ